MIRAHHIGTTTVQGPAHDMPAPFDPAAHNADRAQIAALGADPVPAVRRSPLEHERDAGPRESTADMIARLRNPGAWVSPDDLARLIALVDELLLRSARQFALAHEAGRAVEGGE